MKDWAAYLRPSVEQPTLRGSPVLGRRGLKPSARVERRNIDTPGSDANKAFGCRASLANHMLEERSLRNICQRDTEMS
jgi:hypothetical protein